MKDNYTQIMKSNLKKLYAHLPPDLAENLEAAREGDTFIFTAFGETCIISPDRVRFGEDGDRQSNPIFKILISLYALHVNSTPMAFEPFKAFKEFPDSAPYAGAFVTHTEQPLVAYVDQIRQRQDEIVAFFKGHKAPDTIGGDFAFVLKPLSKIALCYIFYLADDDFPASVTCLYSNNADSFMPTDGLADIGEYTSQKIIALLT